MDMNESRHKWMSRVTYHWVTNSISMSHELNMGHVLGHVPHMNESRHIWMSRVTYHWVISNYAICLIQILNESRTQYQWVTNSIWVLSLIWMSHDTYVWVVSRVTESYQKWKRWVTDECVISHMNKSCDTGQKLWSCSGTACCIWSVISRISNLNG